MGACRLDFNFRVNRKKNLAGQRISNKMLKKKFFIHLFFSEESQYAFWTRLPFLLQKTQPATTQKLHKPNQPHLQLYLPRNPITI